MIAKCTVEFNVGKGHYGYLCSNHSRMMLSSRYLDFEYDASQLIKFIAAGDFFSCMLKTGDIIHYTPTNPDLFLQWLVAHDIENIRRIERDTFN